MDDQTPQVPIYAYVLLAFSIWMLVDAYRKRAPLHWLLLIVLFFPFGAFAYFAFVKIPELRARPMGGHFNPMGVLATSPPGADFPTDRDLDRADTLEEAERYRDAEPIYLAMLERAPEDKRSLHGLARCRLGEGKPQEAVELFEKLLTQDREYRNFGAALDYADALWQAGQRKDCLEVLEGISKMTDRINHRLALAHYLALDGQRERAREAISAALADQQSLASPESRAGSKFWTERAREMLARLDRDSDPS